jgi:hypothetical protein
MLIDEQDVVLEAGVEMWFESQMYDDGVMMAVDVRVDAIEALEDVADGRREVFGEGHADAGGECGFVVDVGLHPGHEVLDVFGRRHLGGFWVAGRGVLPEVLESRGRCQSCVSLCRAVGSWFTRRWPSSRGRLGASRTR